MKNKIAELLYDCKFDELEYLHKLKVTNIYIEYKNYFTVCENWSDSKIPKVALECYLVYLLIEYIDNFTDEVTFSIKEIVDMSLEDVD